MKNRDEKDPDIDYIEFLQQFTLDNDFSVYEGDLLHRHIVPIAKRRGHVVTPSPKNPTQIAWFSYARCTPRGRLYARKHKISSEVQNNDPRYAALHKKYIEFLQQFHAGNDFFRYRDQLVHGEFERISKDMGHLVNPKHPTGSYRHRETTGVLCTPKGRLYARKHETGRTKNAKPS